MTSRRYHAVISDCQMPDVDGYTLAKWIKHDDRLRQTPFVMLTSLGRPEDPARLRRLGISTYLTKPVKHSDLFDALASLFTVAPKRETRRAKPTPAARARRPLRILVAEDQAVNRRLVPDHPAPSDEPSQVSFPQAASDSFELAAWLVRQERRHPACSAVLDEFMWQG